MNYQEMIGKIIIDDCLNILKRLPDKCIDLVLTDPPYGIKHDYQNKTNCKNPKHNRKLHIKKEWDNCIPTKEIFNEIFRVSKNQIIFGANYFVEYLPKSMGWIVWDKGQRGLSMSDCELIFTSFDKATRIKICNRVELLKDFTFHPTQKPLKLFEMILNDYSNPNDLILDCFSGSGTTAIACHNLNRRFICIEKDYDYWKASVERLENAKQQLNLFRDFDKKEEQEEFKQEGLF